jgi:hypothetical protein
MAGWSVEDGLGLDAARPISIGLLGSADLSWLVGIVVSACSTWRRPIDSDRLMKAPFKPFAKPLGAFTRCRPLNGRMENTL